MKESPQTTQVDIELNKVPIVWDLDQGKVTFFGLDAALFWTVPSLSNMLAPMAEEIGVDLFRLLIAHSSSLGTEEDYKAMISTLASEFQAGFLAWGKAVSVAGWGAFEIVEYNPIECMATVMIKNPWELNMQKYLPVEKRWGVPFLQGKLIGIFSQAFNVPCWAIDTCYFDAHPPYAEVKVFPSRMTIVDELNQLRQKRAQEKERELMVLVDQRTIELREAKDKIQEYSVMLERKVEERTASLLSLNAQLEDEINIRKRAEEKLATINQELVALSFTDKLTGIANRRRFDSVFSSEWNRALRSKSRLCLILADVDWFKKYNDIYGHQQGDVCLQFVAKLLANGINRAGDFVARYGGEEFALILPLTDETEAAGIVQKIITEFRALHLPHAGSEYGYVTVSFGIASIVPKEWQTAEQFFKMADDALYTAKTAGRNTFAKHTY